MEILLSNSSGVPLYQQIVVQVRGMIMTGELKAGEPLPSMRQLARELRISLITTKRAYEELEAMGLLETVGGKGSFVGAASPAKLAEQHRADLESVVIKAVAAAVAGGVSLPELQRMVAECYKRERGNIDG